LKTAFCVQRMAEIRRLDTLDGSTARLHTRYS
jgi:hypothetical protein